jgi:hypothetical protein
MNRNHVWRRIAAVNEGILTGALAGVFLAAFGSALTSSPASIGLAVLAGALLGGCGRRIDGVLVGALCGVLFSAFASVVGGSHLGMGMTVAGCAGLGGWLGWTREPRDDEPCPEEDDQEFLPGHDPLRKPVSPLKKKELALWT